jgi:hypothetical protein
MGERQGKRQRTAALQNLAEGVARNPSRQRLGVRLSSAALICVRSHREFPQLQALRIVTTAATNFRSTGAVNI